MRQSFAARRCERICPYPSAAEPMRVVAFGRAPPIPGMATESASKRASASPTQTYSVSPSRSNCTCRGSWLPSPENEKVCRRGSGPVGAGGADTGSRPSRLEKSACRLAPALR